MTNTKELILAKVNEITDLLAQVKCDGLDLADADCEDVSDELYSALCKFEEAVDYYAD